MNEVQEARRRLIRKLGKAELGLAKLNAAIMREPPGPRRNRMIDLQRRLAAAIEDNLIFLSSDTEKNHG